MKQTLKIGHICPELLNLYGDLGNIAVLKQRCLWRGIDVTVKNYKVGDEIPFSELDIILLGGGSDREQAIVCEYLKQLKPELKAYTDAGKVLLAICGGYQLLGDYYENKKDKIEGIGLLDLYTKQNTRRLVGHSVLESEITGSPLTVVGFENHGGLTYHKYQTFGKVIKGFGNNHEDGLEGLVEKHILGTYLHGPLLTKNPKVADRLLTWALEEKYGVSQLEPLDDTLENKARDVMLQRI